MIAMIQIKRMRNIFSQSAKRVGLPPGSAIYTGEKKDTQVKLSLFSYSKDTFEEKAEAEFSDLEKIGNDETSHWVNFDGVSDVEKVQKIGELFDLHPLTVEDILHTEQRPKLEENPNYLYVIFHMLHFDETTDHVDKEQVSLVLVNNTVLTLQEKEGDTFEPVRNRLRTSSGRIRKSGPDYLLYALMDTIVDHYFVVLEKIGDRLEDIEEEILLNPSKESFNLLYALRREMIQVRRSVWPLRELVNKLEREELTYIKKDTRIFLRDLYDHTIQVIETIENYRDLLSSMGDLYQSIISNKMNGVMKVLTIISTVFIPLTFVAGVYGMNFEHIPEFKWHYGYAYFWALIVGILVTTLMIFRRNRWL